jgi:hypothetical protein
MTWCLSSQSICFALRKKLKSSLVRSTNPPMSAKKACFNVHLSSCRSCLKRATDARADCHSPSAKMSRYSGPIIEMKVIQILRLRCFHVVSLESGTFRQIADHVDRKMVARQAQTMSKVPRPCGEDVHPCNALLVLFIDILARDCECYNRGRITRFLDVSPHARRLSERNKFLCTFAKIECLPLIA